MRFAIPLSVLLIFSWLSGPSLAQDDFEAGAWELGPPSPKKVKKMTGLYFLGGGTDVSLSKDNWDVETDSSEDVSFFLEFATKSSPKTHISLGLGHTAVSFKKSPFGFSRSDYRGAYGTTYREREIEGHFISVDLRLRHFPAPKRNLRFFVGAAFGFNRLALEFDGDVEESARSGDSSSGYSNYGDESYSGFFMNISALLGLFIPFGDSMRIIVQGQFGKNFGGNEEARSFLVPTGSFSYVNDQILLDQLASQIEDGTQSSVLMGLGLSF
ncbi:MAG: hypothetical protein OXB88_02875 [Bacteriovoracales bacterium]|nr:hypothetical protein [Bacteriovoracales bacterium]